MLLGMPWWAVLYLVIFIVASILSMIDEFKLNRLYGLFSLYSNIFTLCFIYAFFNDAFQSHLGGIIFPMLITGAAWEIFSAVKDIKAEKNRMLQDNEISNTEAKTLLIAGSLVGGLLVVPGYAVGVWLCLDYLKGL